MTLEPLLLPGRVAARLARQVELALATAELTLAQYRVLVILDEGNEAASALAEKLAVSRPSITAVVDGLVARGLVERRAEAADRRRVRHDITPDGHQALVVADAAVDVRLREIAASAGDEVAVKALEALDFWRLALDSHWSGRATRRAEAALAEEPARLEAAALAL